MKAYKKLDSNMKILIEQVAANPAFMQMLLIQKGEIQEQILNFWALEKESDADYRRRNELLNMEFRYLKEQIEFYENLLKK